MVVGVDNATAALVFQCSYWVMTHDLTMYDASEELLGWFIAVIV